MVKEMLDTFLTCLIRVVVSLCFIIPGFVLCKLKRASANHLSTMSTILVYVCGPCMVIYAFYNASVNASLKGMDKGQMALEMLYFAIATLLLQSFVILALYFIFKRKYDDAKYRLLTGASVLGNVGFFGLPLVVSLVDNPIVACYSSIYVLTMNLLVFTVGIQPTKPFQPKSLKNLKTQQKRQLRSLTKNRLIVLQRKTKQTKMDSFASIHFLKFQTKMNLTSLKRSS